MGPVLLAYVGVALMVGLSGIGSAFGLTICGNAVVGAMKKAPEKMGTYIALSALPSSQGLYGFVAYMMVQKFLVADMPWVTAAGIFGAGLIMGFAGFYSSIRQAHVCANGIAATGVMAVFPELYAILALVVSILISFTFPAVAA